MLPTLLPLLLRTKSEFLTIPKMVRQHHLWPPPPTMLEAWGASMWKPSSALSAFTPAAHSPLQVLPLWSRRNQLLLASQACSKEHHLKQALYDPPASGGVYLAPWHLTFLCYLLRITHYLGILFVHLPPTTPTQKISSVKHGLLLNFLP